MKKQLLLLVSLLLPLVASADAVEIDGIYYNLVSEGQAEVTSNQSEYSGDITIPESVIYNDVTYSVTSIGNYAFLFCTNLTSIEIPNSVTSIGDEAFYFCMSLTSITIPNSVTSIGYNAFDETPWYDNQPDGLVYAGKVAYKYKGTMPDNTNITIKKGTLGIAGGTFSECSGLTSITIPNSVTSIGSEAFYRCSGLTAIEIPNSVTSIGSSAFSYCSGLTAISIENGNPKYDTRDNCNAIIETSSNTLIAGCKTTIIPNSVTSIGSSAFYRCTGLTSIEIPNSVTSIGTYAFSTCTGLTSVTIGNSVTSIGSSAFSYCSGLTSIEIPNSVTSIGDDAFYECTGLTSITIPNSVTSIGYNAFDETSWYDNQPDGLVYAGKVAYKYKGTMPDNTSIKIKEGTLEIVDLTFKDCSGLTSITIPNSVTSIGDLAFYRCTGLTSVSIKKEAPLPIGESTFSNRDNATLYVPYGCKAAYEAADYWKEFKSIIEFGDADGDGSVDVNDVTSTINYILNKPVAKFIIEAADMDQDGKIDVNDVQAIIYKALGK